MWEEDKTRLGLGPIEGMTAGAEPVAAGAADVIPVEQPDTTSFTAAIGPARELYGTANWASRWYAQKQIPVDPNYKLESNYNELMKDVPQLYQGPLNEQLVDARSAEEAWSIRDQFINEMGWQEEISKQGWKGAAAAFGVSMVDEGSVFLTLLGPTAVLARSTQVARAVNSALKGSKVAAYAIAGAAENASIEALGVAASKTRSPMDVAYAAAFGGLFGAGAGHFMPALDSPRRPPADLDTSQPDVGAPHARAVSELDATIEANARGDDNLIDHPVTSQFSKDSEDAMRVMGGQDPVEAIPKAERVAPIATVAEPKKAKAAAKAEAETAKLNARLKELADEEVLEPVRPTLLAEIDKAKAAMAKAVDPQTLDPQARVRQQQELTNIRRHVMTVIQKEDPDTFAKLGLGRNPSAEDFKLLMDKGAKKLTARVEAAYKKDLADYEARLSAIDKELTKTRSRLQQLDAEKRIAGRATLGLPKAEVSPQGPSGSLGAAAVDVEPRSPADVSATEYDEFVSNAPEQVPFGAGRKLSSAYAKLATDPNHAVRWVASKLMSDHVGTMDGSASPHGAVVLYDDFKHTVMAPFVRDHKNAYRDWLQAQGIPWYKRFASDQAELARFDDLVGDAIEGFGDGIGDANVMKAVQATRKVLKDTKDWAERAGLEGFDQFATDPNYLPHVHNSEAGRRIRRDHRLMEGTPERMPGWGVDEELVYQGLRRADPDLDPETAALIARNYMDIVLKKDAGLRGQYFDMSRIGEEGYIEATFDALGIDRAQMQAFLDLRQRMLKPAESERVKYAKRRTVLDMRTRIPAKLIDEDGNVEIVEIGLKDMFHRGAGRLTNSYVRSVGGRAAIAEATKGTAFHVTSDKKWNDLIGKVRQFEIGEDMQRGKHFGTLDGAMNDLEMVRNSMIGIPVNDNPAFNSITRFLLRYNFIGRMGQVAWAQMAENGALMSRLGLNRMIHQIPEVAEYFKRDADGRLTHPLARLGEEEMGAGADAAMGRHFGDHITDVEAIEGRVPMWENMMQTAERIVSYPMRKVMVAQQRMLNIGVWHELGDMAKGRIPFYNAEQMARWGDLGMSEAEMRKVVELIGQKGTFDGNRLSYPGHDQWGDYDLWLKFRRSMFRLTRRIVQENDPGNLPSIMPKNMAKLAFQFRTFQIGAIDKQLLTNINAIRRSRGRDMEAWLNFGYQTMWASAAYYGMVETKSLLMPEEDRKEFRTKMLSPERVASAAFARAGYSTLIPGTIDTALWVAGVDPVFALSRGSGLQQNFITGNPSVQLSQNVMKAARGVVAPIINPDYQFSKQDMRAWQSVLPFSTLPGMYNLWNATPQLFDLPKTSTED